jgi:hypothetical protein
MRFPWVIVGTTGYDVEDIDHPRTHEMECPSCGKHVRFVEKELIKNLRVFGVPLVGVEKGRRVFECPHCRVCVEPPEGGVDTTESAVAERAEDPQIAVIEARLKRLDDEIWLWRSRAKVAAEKGARDLEFEALEWQTKAEREANGLRDRLATLKSAAASEPPGAAPSATAKAPAIVARKGGEIVDRAADDEFAALKAKLARKQASGDEGASEPSKPVDASAPTVSERAPTETETRSTETSDQADDEAFAALKAKLARKHEGADAATSSSEAEYQSLRQEMRDAPPAVDPNAPIAADAKPAAAPPSADDDDDDPVAALKRKLRGK